MTRTTRIVFSVVLLVFLAIPRAHASNTPKPAPKIEIRVPHVLSPSGVAAGSWVQISKSLGFVIERQLGAPGAGQLPIAQGYFVVKRNGHWLRLDSIAHGAIFHGSMKSTE
jgi:hypothetical protein